LLLGASVPTTCPLKLPSRDLTVRALPSAGALDAAGFWVASAPRDDGVEQATHSKAAVAMAASLRMVI